MYKNKTLGVKKGKVKFALFDLSILVVMTTRTVYVTVI